ncbi:1-acyl-sn-glycerol-3-phosphate acyltransferase [Akkermansiaceae bacterium]|nr:1-acyl-sn-glycerol-3-phosphate acyltransferase [Akkermansiaceae bacterium]
MKTTYWFGHTIFRAAAKAFFRYQVVGRDKLITDGSVLIASNHESFLDPPLVGIAYNDSVYYLARKTLFRGVTKWLYSRWNAIPIDQDAPDMSSLKKIIKILKSGEQVVVFPEGSRTLDGDLQRGEAGVGLIAAKSRAIIQPVRIFGAFEPLEFPPPPARSAATVLWSTGHQTGGFPASGQDGEAAGPRAVMIAIKIFSPPLKLARPATPS